MNEGGLGLQDAPEIVARMGNRLARPGEDRHKVGNSVLNRHTSGDRPVFYGFGPGNDGVIAGRKGSGS